jgi:RNA polymerase sigma-70 factor (ECF subfamily)
VHVDRCGYCQRSESGADHPRIRKDGSLKVDRIAQFEEVKESLFLLAYRMLGARAYAKDVVQEAYLRWLNASDEDIRMPKSYLTTVVSRLSLDVLKSAQTKREIYTGQWLPEPLVEPLGSQRLEMAESLSMAFLQVLELLSPTERVAFLLREVFETSYTELAEILETTEENCRQIVARARKHIRTKHARFVVDPEKHMQVLREFVTACASGDPARLADLLREDAVMYSDGGGKVLAALNPIFGGDHIARFFTGVMRKAQLDALRAEVLMVNGLPGVLVFAGNDIQSVMSLALDENNKVARIFLVVNPEKLPGKTRPVDEG